MAVCSVVPLKAFARPLGFGEGLVPVSLKLQNLGAVHLAHAVECLGLRVAPAPVVQNRGPFPRPHHFEHTAAGRQDFAIDDAGHDRRKTFAVGQEHSLINRAIALVDPPQPEQDAAFEAPSKRDKVKSPAASPNSHEAIRNVLMGCLLALEDAGSDITLDSATLAHKVSGEDDGYPDGTIGIARTTSNDDPVLLSANVVGGTTFLFARPEFEESFDWLFVDEAGQVSLANLLAMGRAARNIVLVGDPRQLPQVIQGSHPHPANLSCLEWLLGDHATIPVDRGIFLPRSRRMHPDVCRFVSNQVYEGRLTSEPDTARQMVAGTAFPQAGAFWVPVMHEGNAQVSPEEVAAIRAAIDELLRGDWTDKEGTTRPIRATDIIVVAPYNAQVNALRDALPDAIRVGTVDKFQGQEAPICLVSMTASSAEETSRGMEFLFSLNRINVAVSRAKGLALVFGSPRLREAKCETVEQCVGEYLVCVTGKRGHLNVAGN